MFFEGFKFYDVSYACQNVLSNDYRYTCGRSIDTSKTMPIMINHEKDFKRKIGYENNVHLYGYRYGYVRIIGNLLLNLNDQLELVFNLQYIIKLINKLRKYLS